MSSAAPAVRSGAAALIAMLTATTSLSQFYRASTTVIAPELIRDIGLTPEMLGFSGACFFLALGAAQVPVGILFDRIGARLTVALLAVLAVLGSLAHAAVASGGQLAAARFVIGLGHGGSFMATVFLISRWYPRARWSTALSWVFASSMLGIAAAGAPLAFVSERFGWRAAFVIVAVIQAAVGVLFLLLVRDDPPDAAPRLGEHETLRKALAGFVTILRLPGFRRVMMLQFFAYAVLATMMGLWAGPYLHDVHGLDPIARGNVLIAMAAAQTVGVLATGPLDRLFNTRKWVATAGAVATIAVLLALAVHPRPPIAVAITLLLVLCAVSAYGVVVVSHGRTFYPEPLAGRGATTFNMAQVLGCALMPIATGFIPRFFPITEKGYAPEAYQFIFVAIAAMLGAGLAVYLTAVDARPDPDRPIGLARAPSRVG